MHGTDQDPQNLPRPITLEKASNLRDLGGWPAKDGRRVRTGLIFRAPALIGLSEADQAAVAGLGLKTICDFRGLRERARNPVEIAGATHISLPIEPSVGGSLGDLVRTGEATGHMSPADMLDLLRKAYRAFALENFTQYRALFDRIIEPSSLPLLLHCSAGKDRTGFGSALLLTALGVPWTYVVQDYLATNRDWRREIAREFLLPDDVKEVLLTAHELLLDAAFDAIAQAYGSIDAYLHDAIGLDDRARKTLNALLLTP